MPPPGAVYLGTDGGPVLPPEDADEVLDLAVAPAGSHVLVWISSDLPPVKGQVARTDEAGDAMLVVLEDGAERWVASDDRWALEELQPNDALLEETSETSALLEETSSAGRKPAFWRTPVTW